MQKVSGKQLLTATEGHLLYGDDHVEFTGICTDSRKIRSGELFIPLVGDNFDGHDFIQDAVKAGAAGYITQRGTDVSEQIVVIKVDDTLKAMHKIAKYYREQFDIKVVAVTGSTGKTSTKEMISSVLGQKYNILKSAGNFNNQVGLPLTLFGIEKKHNVVVVEMGMNSLGEIETLSQIAQPDIAIITNIGISHIEKLGSRQNILRAKMEVLHGLKSDGVLILNGDDALLSGAKNFIRAKVKCYGMEQETDIYANNIKLKSECQLSFDVTTKYWEHSFCLSVPGRHNVYNALAAIAVGMEFNMEPQEMENGLNDYTQQNMRMSMLNIGNDIIVINDTYNASPQSMEAAISVLGEMKCKGRRIAVLGDMLELGDWSEKAHREVGRLLYVNNIDYVITMGENACAIGEGAIQSGMSAANVKMLDKIEEINSLLISLVKNGDIILVKGSRGMKMERVVDFLRNL